MDSLSRRIKIDSFLHEESIDRLHRVMKGSSEKKGELRADLTCIQKEICELKAKVNTEFSDELNEKTIPSMQYVKSINWSLIRKCEKEYHKFQWGS